MILERGRHSWDFQAGWLHASINWFEGNWMLSLAWMNPRLIGERYSRKP